MNTLKIFYQRTMGSSNIWSSLKPKTILPNFCFFLTMVTSANSLTFDLRNIGAKNQHRDIITQGRGTFVSNRGIEFSAVDISSIAASTAGRVSYAKPLHLWDNASGELANFETNFTFALYTTGLTLSPSEGLAFFLSVNNSVLNDKGAIGLPVNSTTNNATNQFVAVEIDTLWNQWDPRDIKNSPLFNHIGININSIVSVKAEKWVRQIFYGGLNEARISYNSSSKNLTVLVLTNVAHSTDVKQYTLQWTVDLRNELPEWVIVGFSSSFGASFSYNIVNSWSFISTDLHTDEPVDRENQRTKQALLVFSLSFGLCVLASSSFFFFWIKKRRAKRENDFSMELRLDYIFNIGSGPKRFRYDDLAHATNDFVEDEKLGQGGFGGVYRGFLMELRSYVAIKKVSGSSMQGIKEYAAEVTIISRLRHKNLVQLIGWCHEKGELLLVYEFLKNGSLDSHLYKEKSVLTWEQRYKIAQGLASAVRYLHEEWEQCVLHKDIKSSNIMLDSKFNAKLGDFGLAKLVDHEKESETACLAGTLGYMAPERCLTGKASKGSDVYSFGVVALEIACGRRSIEYRDNECHVRLVDMVWELYGRGKLFEAVDPKLASDYNKEQMERLMIVGLWCSHPDLNLRPSIKQAIQVLSFEVPLPSLPSAMPVPTYLASSNDLSALWLLFTRGRRGSEHGKTQSSSYTPTINPLKLNNSSQF